MSTNFDSRLQSLKQRRQGSQGIISKAALTMDSAYSGVVTESYESRSANKATRYALGAMQQVDPEYTKNSFAQGERVRNQLQKGLQGEIPVAFEYQGSVPLNVHIRYASDIDLLVLHDRYITVDTTGVKNQRGAYSNWTGDSGLQLLLNLRYRSESVLRSAFPEVKVEMGSKSIALSGGSLSRKVDVVPSHWHDTATYQSTGQVRDRGVCILDTSNYDIVKNYPFLHMHQINAKDAITNGGAKKLIRLLKTLKSDSDYAKSITLNSYDIAGLVWNFSQNALTVQYWNELSLIAVAKNELSSLVLNKTRAMQLRTPDNTRCVIDSDEKYVALVLLCSEVSALGEAVTQEMLGTTAKVPDEKIHSTLQSAIVF